MDSLSWIFRIAFAYRFETVSTLIFAAWLFQWNCIGYRKFFQALNFRYFRKPFLKAQDAYKLLVLT